MIRGVNLLVVLAGMLAGPLLLSRFMAVYSLQRLAGPPQDAAGTAPAICWWPASRFPTRGGAWEVGPWSSKSRFARPPAGPAGTPPSSRYSRRSTSPMCPPAAPAKAPIAAGLPSGGRYQLGPLRLSTRFPFGLFCHTRDRGADRVAGGLPPPGTAHPRLDPRHRESFAGSQRREQRAGVDGDFYGIRPWRSGDSRRWIHGRTSARSGKLMVLQFEQPRNRDVALLLDLWQPERPERRHCQHVELAVSFAATVVADLCRQGGGNVYLGALGPGPQCTGGPASPALLQDLMKQLALVERTQPRRPGRVVRRDPQPHRVGGGVGPGHHPARRLRAIRRGCGGWSPTRSAAPCCGGCGVIDTSAAELDRYFQME